MGPKHPTIDLLKLYSLERLNKREMARVDEHLVICAECRKRVSSLAGTTESTAVAECRRLFLKAAASHPKIRLADSLRQTVLVPTKKLWVELGLPVPNLPASQWTEVHDKALESWNHEHERLLRIWAKDAHLHFDWVLSEAVQQLSTWRSFPEIKTPFTDIFGYQAPQLFLELWFFEHEQERDYRKRMKTKFVTALEAHIRDVKRFRSSLCPTAALEPCIIIGRRNMCVSAGGGLRSRRPTRSTLVGRQCRTL